MNKVSKILASVMEMPVTDGERLKKFEWLSAHIAEENKKVNITSITDEVGIATKHFADSLSLLRLDAFQKENIKVADIGCGGGFPGLPIKIMRDDIDITMLDSTEKKIRYVEATAKAMGLEKIKCISGRAEEISADGSALREAFDVVTSRAVARLSVLSEICLPFVKVGGYFVSMKAADADNELLEAKNGFAKLGGKLEKCVEIPFTFDGLDTSDFTDEEKKQLEEFSGARRVLVVVKKVKPTPSQYPRAWAKIIKKPL
jgi:16S rRNA (guanine527-N7)-methyltransferase